MLNGYNNARKRNFAESSAVAVVNAGTRLIKRARRVLRRPHPAERPVPGQNHLDALPDELKLQIFNFLPFANTSHLRETSKAQHLLISMDYYRALLNSDSVQADIQFPINSFEELQRLFGYQQVEIYYLMDNTQAILTKANKQLAAMAHYNYYPSAIPAACQYYLSESLAAKAKQIIHCIPEALKGDVVGMALAAGIGERGFSDFYWHSVYNQHLQSLRKQLAMLSSLPEEITPFTVFQRHRLLNGINEDIVRLIILFKQFLNIERLSFNYSHLTRLPAALLDDKQLQSVWSQCQELSLEGNALCSLPLNLKQFQNIKAVFVSHNEFEAFPSVLLELPLMYLGIEYNRLSELPDSVSSILRNQQGRLTKAEVLETQEVIESDESEIEAVDMTINRRAPG